ncbi:hypothetical protein PX699_15520 [Sphingobium sp. H39-3-25]|uniref:hypothetical protein n=1 Tax=Sphingobium arseniciresistens TaxID=3030834 RepID=UPI0023B95A9C|nr:hypothetical protein [Sphingobium arseniciresistens]
MFVIIVAFVSFACGVLLTGMLAALVIGLLHREAAQMVDSAILMAGLGAGSAVVYHHDGAQGSRAIP